MLERTGLFAESWNVAWRKKDTGSILVDKKTVFNIINNSFLYWAADPFIFKYKNDIYIFAELYDYIHCRGSLGYCKLIENKKCRWQRIILEDYHLSYPFIWSVGEEVYIMPESGANNSIYIYRAIEFPNKWEKISTLRKNVKYGDTTPFVINNHRLAITYDVQENNNYKLVLLDLDNPDMDKIIFWDNLYSKRPAGKIFFMKNKMIRPAQNCENEYGEGLIFYKCFFSESGDYMETELSRIYPDELNYSRKILLDGMHTYNSIDGYEVIDIKTRRFNIVNFLFRMLKRVSRRKL